MTLDWHIIYTLLIYFVIGGIGVAFIASRKTGEERRESWVKYVVYLGIITTLQTVFFHRQFSFFALSLIATVGLGEMFFAARRVGMLFLINALFTYILLSGAFVLLAADKSPTLVRTYFLVVVFDGFSQIIGQIAGGQKLIPKISPNKTISGLLGGTITALVTSAICFGTESVFPWAMSVIISALVGDLLASWVKRRAGIKDYSTLIPGHGGFLDRFDSFILAGAIQTIWIIAQS
ncbi:MAG: phosphatidate cytidylyltransferase [Flavobacteriales bacterium]